MKIGIGSDHGGFVLKEHLKRYLREKNCEVIDYGCESVKSCDYPVFAHRLCQALTAGEIGKGILICTTGIGMSIVANRYPGIRAALTVNEDMCRLSRQHNDANVLVLGAAYTNFGEAERYTDIFFTASFEGGRHERRIKLMERDSKQ